MAQEHGTMTQEEFDRILRETVGDLSARTILDIPGIYEIMAKHFHDEVMDQWKEEQQLNLTPDDKDNDKDD